MTATRSSVVGTLWRCVECETAHPWYVSVCHVCETSLLETLFRRRWWSNVLHQHECLSSSFSFPPVAGKRAATASFSREEAEEQKEEASNASSASNRLLRSSSLVSVSPPSHSSCSCCGAAVQWIQRRCWRCGTVHDPVSSLRDHAPALDARPRSSWASRRKKDKKRRVVEDGAEVIPHWLRSIPPSPPKEEPTAWTWFPPLLPMVEVPGAFVGPAPPPALAMTSYSLSVAGRAGSSFPVSSVAIFPHRPCSAILFPPLQRVLDAIWYLPLHTEEGPHAFLRTRQNEESERTKEEEVDGSSLCCTTAIACHPPAWKGHHTETNRERREEGAEKKEAEAHAASRSSIDRVTAQTKESRPRRDPAGEPLYESSWRSWWMLVRARLLQNESKWWQGTSTSPVASASFPLTRAAPPTSLCSSFRAATDGHDAALLYLLPPSPSSEVLSLPLPFPSEVFPTHLPPTMDTPSDRHRAQGEHREWDEGEPLTDEESFLINTNRSTTRCDRRRSPRTGKEGEGMADEWLVGWPPSCGITALVQQAALMKKEQQHTWEMAKYASSFLSVSSSSSPKETMENEKAEKRDADVQANVAAVAVVVSETTSPPSAKRMASTAALPSIPSGKERKENEAENEGGKEKKKVVHPLPFRLPPSFSSSFLATLFQQVRRDAITHAFHRRDKTREHAPFSPTRDTCSSSCFAAASSAWCPMHVLGCQAVKAMHRPLERLWRIANISSDSCAREGDEVLASSLGVEGELSSFSASLALLPPFVSITRELSVWLEVLTHPSFPKEALPWSSREGVAEEEPQTLFSFPPCSSSLASSHWSLAKEMFTRMVDVLILLRHWERKVERRRKKEERKKRKDKTTTTTIAATVTSTTNPVLSYSSFCGVHCGTYSASNAETSLPCFPLSYSSLWALRCYWFGLTLSWMELLRCHSPFQLDDLGFDALSRVAVEIYYYYHYHHHYSHKNTNNCNNNGSSFRPAAAGPSHEETEGEFQSRKDEQGERKLHQKDHDVEKNTRNSSWKNQRRKERKKNKTEEHDEGMKYAASPASFSISSASPSFLTLPRYIEVLRYTYLLSFQLSAEEMLATAAASGCSRPYRLFTSPVRNEEPRHESPPSSFPSSSSTVRSSPISPPSSSLLPSPQPQSTNERTLVFPTSPFFLSNRKRKNKSKRY